MDENGQPLRQENAVQGTAALRRRARLPATGLERRLLALFISAIGDPPLRVRLWDGSTVGGAAGTRVTATIADRAALWRLLLNPSLCFGEEYADGGIDVESELAEFMSVVLAHRPADMDNRFFTGRLLRRQLNTLAGARDNIRHHYDIGNDFYALWLDAEMAYTCAYYPTPTATLEEAQFAKMELVCRKLNLEADETVVEAGCGWGGLARHMARNYGVRVKAYNISSEQIAYARARARQEGLDDRIEYLEDDYRNISGQYDAFVSVGMLEHVGAENFAALGKVIDRCLHHTGRGLIHSIGQNQALPLSGFIARHIFPGAYPPTLREIAGILEPHRFTLHDVENLRPHYARTLAHWRERFEDAMPQLRSMFDERFLRIWRLYLAASEASFSEHQLQLYQVLFCRPAYAGFPWTRDRIYRSAP